MEFYEIDEDFFVAPQITVEDVNTLAKAGFKTIICNRPDNEGENQPSFDTIANAATKANIASHFIPVTPQTLNAQTIETMRNVLQNAQKPMIAYCLSGIRSKHLYLLAKQK